MCFLGKNKSRFCAVYRLGMQLHALELHTDLVVVPEPGRHHPEQSCVSICQQMLNCSRDIEHINRARCLLAWAHANQAGLTIHTLEARFFDKKPIAKNPWVRAPLFCHPAGFCCGRGRPGADHRFLGSSDAACRRRGTCRARPERTCTSTWTCIAHATHVFT